MQEPFADESYMEEFLDITPGSVSIMGLMNDTDNHVQLLIDKEVLEEASLGCHPCINTSSLKLKTSEVMDKFLPAVHHEALSIIPPNRLTLSTYFHTIVKYTYNI